MSVPRFDFSPAPDDVSAFRGPPKGLARRPHPDEDDHAPFNPTQAFAPSSFGGKHSPPTSVSEASGSRPSTMNGSEESPPTSEDEGVEARMEERRRAESKLSGQAYQASSSAPAAASGPGRPRLNGYGAGEEGSHHHPWSPETDKGAWGLMSPLHINGSAHAGATGVFSPPMRHDSGSSASTPSLGSPDSVQEVTIPSAFPIVNTGRFALQSTPEASSSSSPPPSGGAKHRPSNLLLPMETPSANRGQSPVEGRPSWPFIGRDGARVDLSNLASPAPAYPTTPSAINPAYGDDGPPMTIVPEVPFAGRARGHAGTSSVDVPAHMLDIAASPVMGGSSSATGLGLYTGKGKSPEQHHPRHFYRPSAGTHTLLSSRVMGGSRGGLGSYLAVLARQFRADSPSAWLVYYFAFNLGLTLYNKAVMNKFKFGWTVTALHTLSGTIGTRILLYRGAFVPAELGPRENLSLTLFSTLYTVNIAVSNVSLEMVSVPFHQVIRATTPLFTIVLSTLFLRRKYSQRTYLSLVPVICGVALATWGDYSYTLLGLWLTMLGALLAALKTVATNMIQVGRLKLHPLDLLMRMSPLAFVQSMLWAWWTGELERVREYGATKMTSKFPMVLLLNGAIAFGLNIVSFTANKKTSALTMTIAANVKQVLTIVLAVLLFGNHINALNLLGISLTIIGGAFYARVEMQEKNRKARTAPSPLAQKQAI